MKLPRLSPLQFGLVLAVLDALWTAQAFQALPMRAGSNVALVGFIVWSVFHLPAGMLGGLLLRPFGVLDLEAAELPAWVLGFLGGLGILQSLLLGWGAAAWWRRRRTP
jgi:hypothetical protein